MGADFNVIAACHARVYEGPRHRWLPEPLVEAVRELEGFTPAGA